MQLKQGWQAPCAFALIVALASGAHAQDADADSGWHGVVEPRLNYYWETSTRVVVPTLAVRVDAPTGTHVGANYLVDAITSASIAQTGSEEDQLFTELRHGVGLDVSQDIDLGGSQLQLGVNGVYSTENDYKSYIFGADSAYTFNDKATRLTLAATRVEDRISSNADLSFHGELSGITVAAGLEQALNPTMTLALGYQIGYLEGYLGNPYRRALRGPLPIREAPPETRTRHTVMAHWAWFLPKTATALHVVLSAYTDSWKMKALTPELRVAQMLGRDLMVRPHYRYYHQTKAWFQQAGPYPATWTGPLTNDPKATEMTTHTLGLTIEYQLSFLASTFLDFARNLRLDLNVDRYWSTNRYGNGIIGSGGARLEF